ncbi:MAG: histidinol-phosphatase HisJ family protein [Oscillospiraceae bacterium]|nr:histidinol-phosphatase HisJ family protein [Oscillospiraceae bacterium]
MYYQKRFDGHVHSDCSPRGTDSIMTLCEQAVHRGLFGFAVTDCCDCDRFDEMQFSERVRESVYCVYKARSVFSDSLVISNGIEVGQPLDNIGKADKIINGFPFDMVLASVKKYPDGRKISDIDYSELSENEIVKFLESYYKSLYETSKWENFDVLSQLTFPMRYITRENAPYFSIRHCDDIIEMILKKLAEDGKALEVNTSALRGKLNMILPPVRYLRMFRELGGEFITVGSGSHSCASIGSDLGEGIGLVHEAGFSSYCYYEKRKPVLINIK